LRVLILCLALSLASSSEATAMGFGCMKGVVAHWKEGATTGSFDLEIGGKLRHLAIDTKQGTVDGVPVSRWANGASSPFGTPENPKRVTAFVAFYREGNEHLTAISIYTNDKGCRS
jgi:hypothetical protein